MKTRNMLRVPYSKSLTVASPNTTRTTFIVIARTTGTARSSQPKLALIQQVHTIMFPILNSVSDDKAGGAKYVCVTFSKDFIGSTVQGDKTTE